MFHLSFQESPNLVHIGFPTTISFAVILHGGPKQFQTFSRYVIDRSYCNPTNITRSLDWGLRVDDGCVEMKSLRDSSPRQQSTYLIFDQFLQTDRHQTEIGKLLISLCKEMLAVVSMSTLEFPKKWPAEFIFKKSRKSTHAIIEMDKWKSEFSLYLYVRVDPKSWAVSLIYFSRIYAWIYRYIYLS